MTTGEQTTHHIHRLVYCTSASCLRLFGRSATLNFTVCQLPANATATVLPEILAWTAPGISSFDRIVLWSSSGAPVCPELSPLSSHSRHLQQEVSFNVMLFDELVGLVWSFGFFPSYEQQRSFNSINRPRLFRINIINVVRRRLRKLRLILTFTCLSNVKGNKTHLVFVSNNLYILNIIYYNTINNFTASFFYAATNLTTRKWRFLYKNN